MILCTCRSAVLCDCSLGGAPTWVEVGGHLLRNREELRGREMERNREMHAGIER